MNLRARNPVHTLEGFFQRETDKALLFEVHSVSSVELPKAKTEWFPFSQTEKIHKNNNPEVKDWIVVTEWVLKQKGIEV